jgi:hypothetical protein
LELVIHKGVVQNMFIYNKKEYFYVSEKNGKKYYRCRENPKKELMVDGDVVTEVKIKEVIK